MNTDDPDRTADRDPEPAPSLGDTQIKPGGEQSGVSSPWVAIPGYEIEGELKRGGMGVVYRAKQTGLNRVVALKMILAGAYADPSTRARFLLEAESVAALEHPHVVRVFAFGEHAGHPFLAMEFLQGGTLADRVKASGPLPAREATEYALKLAGAVAHAHSRGVVHRDIKPANVLLTVEGEPRLADFGLAKVGRSDLTGTGQALGTPSYMAPEQAAGKTHEVGTSADVYALGAVLYDLLTGRPPFRGDSVAVTLQKVIADEPERPRKLNASIPRDLETICLKCLEKDPLKRYPTAQALADDLTRFLRDEPISVRPAGALERGYKWVKRNKVVAGAMTAVTLALLVGAGFSLGFGLYANEKAEEAGRKKKEAEEATKREAKEKQDAVDARNEVERKNTELAEAQHRTNRTFAKALLGPITAKNRNQPLTPYEVETFWQLAELRRDEVSWMFLEEATRTPPSCRQLECRAEYALHAVIGLDPVRQVSANNLIFARLRQNSSHTQATSLALTSSRFEHIASPLAAEATDRLLTVLFEERNSGTRSGLAKALSAVAPRLEPARAAKAADVLVAALSKETESYIRTDLAKALSAVAPRLEPAHAAKAADVLVAALSKEEGYGTRTDLAKALSAVAPRLEPAHAAKVCAHAADVFVAALSKGTDYLARGDLVEALSVVAPRLEPALVTKAADVLVAALSEETDSYIRRDLALFLSVVAPRLEPARAAKAADVLVAALSKETNSYIRTDLAKALSAVAPRLEPAHAAKAADVLVAALSKEEGFLARGDLARGLSAVAPRLGNTRAVDILVAALNDERASGAHVALVRGLVGVTFGLSISPSEHAHKTLTCATGTCATPFNVLSALPLHPYLQLPVSRLPPQTLVELLKHPFCVGEARRVVLDALAFTYNRPFKDQWEFVEFAQKHHPELDLLSPPKRPEPRP